jgi:hypothetical protein
VVRDGDRIYRFAQDCQERYGVAVRAFEILALTPETYQERPVGGDPMLAGSGSGWTAEGMHHVDAHLLDDGSWIACVDAYVWGVPDHAIHEELGP